MIGAHAREPGDGDAGRRRVTFDVILLALGSTVRPTSLAALYTLLSNEQPRRMMIAYVISGLLVAIAFGLLVLLAFGGIQFGQGGSTAKGVAQVIGGVVALVFAALVRQDRISVRRSGDAPHVSGRWQQALEGRITVRTAALAGPLTHVPGLFYLAALNIIAAHDVSAATAVVEVLVYTAIWFALPIGALAVCIVQPDAARDAIAAINVWARDHSRGIIIAVSAVVGAVLLIRGVITL
jgi:hypothetical protein